MTTIIKIDRSTVKVNPRAGATQSHIFNGSDIFFDYAVIGKSDFDKLKRLDAKKDGVHINQWGIVAGSSLYFATGTLVNDTYIAEMPQKGLLIGIKQNIDTVNHLPESKYLFNYEPTKVPCSNCGFMVLHSEIDQECDDYTCYDVCPKCEKTDTFDYRYESIFIVAKELNL